VALLSSACWHILDVRGDFACFSRPEMKVERYSYPCPTPSAARGIFEAIYFKPEFFWQVTRIEILNPPSLIALRRNEVKEKISDRAVQQWMGGKNAVEPIWADASGDDFKGRTQRQTMALRNPRFRLTARIVSRSGDPAKQRAADEQFVRRASQGKCFYQPCLGCREFVAFFRYVPSLDDENEPKPFDFSQKLGWMLYDVFDLRENNHAEIVVKKSEDVFERRPNGWKDVKPFIALFQAEVKNGVLESPDYDSDAVKKPELAERRAV
jgi:CRISPR-associated protein Cas5d